MFLYTFLAATVWLCLGINDPGKQVNDYNLAARALQPDCWWNWGIYDERHFADPKFVPSYFKLTDGSVAQAATYAKKFPGRTWLIYNEPEGSNGGQANVAPATAAAMFAKLYPAIKTADPTAIVACCGVIVSTQGVDWLAAFMRATTVRPDKWHVHIYGGTDPATWNYYANYQDYWVEAFGGQRGYFVSETCGMWSGDQTALLKHVAAQQRPRLERMMWFGAYPEPYVPDWKCNLLKSDKSRTYLGNVFADIITQRNAGTPTPGSTSSPTATATRTPTRTATPIAPTATRTPTPTATPIGQCLATSLVDELSAAQARIAELEQALASYAPALPDLAAAPAVQTLAEVTTPEIVEAQPNSYYIPFAGKE